MFEIKVEQAIIQIVEAALPVGSDHALYIKIDVQLRKDYDHEQFVSSLVHFVFHRKTSYTKVWFSENNEIGDPDLRRFKLVSDHDSCWRTDGFRPLTQAYFRMAEELAPDTAPVNLHQHSSFWSVDKARIAFKNDPKDEHGYLKILTELERFR